MAKYKPIADRLMDLSTPVTETGCWLWLGQCDRGGYARIHTRKGMESAHRVSYETFVGPIPTGLDLDHLCRVRCCINPAHLEPVTQQVNSIRGLAPTVSVAAAAAKKNAMTHCKHGHEYTPENLRIYEKGDRRFRYCATCLKIHNTRKNEERKRLHNPPPPV